MNSTESSKAAILLRRRYELSPVQLTAASAVVFALFYNTAFWQHILGNGRLSGASGVAIAAGTFLLLASLNFLLLSPLLTRWTAKPVLAVLVVLTAAAAYFMDRYGAYMDRAMMRNVLATDWREAHDLLRPDMLPWLAAYGALPLWLLSRTDIRTLPLRQSWWHGPAGMVIAMLAAGAGLWMASSQLVPQLREHKEIRYLATPGNYLVSLASALGSSASARKAEKIPVGTDAQRAPAVQRPRVLVIVVGETVRAANWGLNGYARQTTPQLASRAVFNFSDVTACGTNTEVSLPCMFSLQGRRNYDEEIILNSESLLHIAQRAGIAVTWIDNQSGCKGVCAGLRQVDPRVQAPSSLCTDGECLDGVLFDALQRELSANAGDQLVILHQMGNHGPAYFKRYPAEFARFQPACETADLWQCTPEALANAYDNAILYTDDLLGRIIDLLESQSASRDMALIYVSDHGESLGENGLYLHSLPRAIAPSTQTHVPMVMWLSGRMQKSLGLDAPCMSARGKQALTHDNLFHTALGLLGVETRAREPTLDLIGNCRTSGH